MAAPLYSVYPGMGDGFLIISFVVVVVGGLGSVAGAFWAALLVGLVDRLGKVFLPVGAGAAVCRPIATSSLHLCSAVRWRGSRAINGR